MIMDNRERLNEMLQDAYSVPEPRRELVDRLNREAVSMPAPKRGRFGVLRVMLLAVALLAVVGFAYTVLFRRTGEAAIAIIPSDASMVVTVDLVPSEGQVAAFKKIADALKREGLDSKLTEGIAKQTGKDAGIVRDLQPYLTHNMAFAEWSNPQGGEGLHALLLPVTNTSAVEKVLSRYGARVPMDGSVYKIADKSLGNEFVQGEGLAGIIGEYLVATNSRALYSRIALAQKGAGETVAHLAAYQEARAALPADANLMVFVSPTAMADASKSTGVKAVKGARWMCFGAAVRDNGIRIDFRSPMDEKTLPTLPKSGTLDPNLLRRLPNGALGITSVADLGEGLRWMDESAGDAKVVTDGMASFEKESGINFKKDIVPALHGTTALAVYPGASGHGLDVDAMLLFSGDNNATPELLESKLRKLYESQTQKNSAASKLQRIEYSGATVWAPSSSATKNMNESMQDLGVSNREFCWATVDRSVILATSKPMLFRAIRSYRGAGVLAEDQPFANMATQVSDRAQMVTMISINRVLKQMASENQPGELEDWVSAFGSPNDGLVISGYLDGDLVVGSALIPLDYDKAAKAIAKALKSDPVDAFRAEPSIDMSQPK